MDLRRPASLVNFLGKAALLYLLHLAGTASESGKRHFSTIPFITSVYYGLPRNKLRIIYELECDCLTRMEILLHNDLTVSIPTAQAPHTLNCKYHSITQVHTVRQESNRDFKTRLKISFCRSRIAVNEQYDHAAY